MSTPPTICRLAQLMSAPQKRRCLAQMTSEQGKMALTITKFITKPLNSVSNDVYPPNFIGLSKTRLFGSANILAPQNDVIWLSPDLNNKSYNLYVSLNRVHGSP